MYGNFVFIIAIFLLGTACSSGSGPSASISSDPPLNVLVVEDSVTGDDDGSIWVNAYADLQDAMAASSDSWITYGAFVWNCPGNYSAPC